MPRHVCGGQQIILWSQVLLFFLLHLSGYMDQSLVTSGIQQVPLCTEQPCRSNSSCLPSIFSLVLTFELQNPKR